jgi:DNA-binding GntR family transcriptional regulator
VVADRIAARDPEGARLGMRRLILGAREDIDRGGPVDPGFIAGLGG